MKKLLIVLGLLFVPAIAHAQSLTITECNVTTAAPSYTDSTQRPCSLDTSGGLRIGGSITATNASTGSTGSAVPGSATYVGGNKSGNLTGVTLDGSGNLNVNVAAGGAAGGTSSTFGAAIPGTGTAIGMSDGTNMQNPRLFDLDSGGGTQYGIGVDLRFIASGGSVEAGTSSNPLRVDTTGSTTQPVSAASLPLPALAATSTKQSDGSQKTQIVDGSGNVIASTSNNLNVQCANCSGSGASAADGASFTAGASTFAPSGCFFQTTGTNNPLTTGLQGMAQCTAQRAWFTNLRNAAGTEVGTSTTPLQVTLANTGANATAVKVDNSAVTQPVSGTVSITANSAVNVAQINGVTPLMGNGATGTGALRVSIANDSTGIVAITTGAAQIGHLEANQSSNVAQINGVTPLMGNGVTGTGSQRVTIASDNTSNSNPFLVNGAVTPADALALGTTSVAVVSKNSVYNGTTTDLQREAANGTNSTGTGIAAAAIIGQCDDTSPTAITENQFGNARIDCATHAQLVTTVPSATAGGTTLYTLTAANSTNATNVKASAGQIYSISGYTISATAAWISLYNNAGTPTCGTSIIQQYLIPGNSSGAGFNIDFATPKGFATGIAFCITTGIAGTGSVAASSYVLNVDYK